MRALRLLPWVALTLLLGSGCAPDIVQGTIHYQLSDRTGGATLQNAEVQGTIAGYEAGPNVRWVRDDARVLTLHATGDDWVMNELRLNRRLEGIEPGTTTGARMLGCSGPSRGDWQYEGFANRVTVQVEQGDSPNDRVLTYEAEFGYFSDY